MKETVEVLGLLNVPWQNLHFNSEKINGKSTYMGAVAREKYEKRSLSSLHGLWMHAERWREKAGHLYQQGPQWIRLGAIII